MSWQPLPSTSHTDADVSPLVSKPAVSLPVPVSVAVVSPDVLSSLLPFDVDVASVLVASVVVGGVVIVADVDGPVLVVSSVVLAVVSSSPSAGQPVHTRATIMEKYFAWFMAGLRCREIASRSAARPTLHLIAFHMAEGAAILVRALALLRASWPAALSCIALVSLAPRLAEASNMTHPRTPVLWDDVPCLTLHDRSRGPIVHLPYAIPFEDTEPGPDEVTNSRTHQFFAFCRSHSASDYLPTWITPTDVDDAVAVGLIEAGVVVPEDIMETSVAWEGCWIRINADDDRRVIDFANADAGVEWDTTDLAPGGYSIEGYTYEPVFNVWWRRPGAIKLHDGDPDAVGPVAAISTGELTPYRDDTVMLEGCVDALPGTTFTVLYALTSPEAPEWFEYLADQPIAGDEFAFELTPPPQLWGQSGVIRVDFTDPMDRTYTAYQAENILVIDEDNPASCGEDSGSAGSCGESSSSSSSDPDGSSSDPATTASGSTTSDAGSDAETSMLDELPADGCGCATTSSPASAIVLLALAGRRRRRR